METITFGPRAGPPEIGTFVFLDIYQGMYYCKVRYRDIETNRLWLDCATALLSAQICAQIHEVQIGGPQKNEEMTGNGHRTHQRFPVLRAESVAR